ncbi:50S ribosomal protein L13 [Patescibacteria group bacterium]|nr:50S ribosomal protein L13 [Patescibacteria group bacterium]MBU4274907.1 50S ribosomal protein L13 [Patescibacteria group bacterium]MBU4367911.1 50S ribosomal protein L13 [Patescibacteria group bacterium]MBU4461912.1 50S ribosomal protein L13 [Patescibacteria group bacterium]MCG2699855.1 50S ribosomal protein L13 [Candidatus Parcubacteria bacterium]
MKQTKRPVSAKTAVSREKHKIDATDKILGRLAAEIAVLLRGKNKIGFLPNKDIGDFVIVANVGKIKITGRKIEQKKYYHHTGYLGGLKAKSLKTLIVENPAEVLKKAVFGMLPKNKLRAKQIKRLKFSSS